MTYAGLIFFLIELFEHLTVRKQMTDVIWLVSDT